ncbi:hypothetical protein L198_05840 [Cryptococcus wingfieldii CBS 7118]|uniref:Uncharacterized protein n=1 Tax=Cryptococcus wingfieldii CBS 7118 TaxID=1295528 RepID=A0A1E3IRW9_9TREE|nr:hypothetical protein L198_05840 [Cryptococcus wingfieldii CBS 7118]ODN91329.1 hypothetical protein L198_05840 [Cryptococcus wingfieldii CBS 7118]
MSSDYATERSSVPTHVSRIVETFFSKLDANTMFKEDDREILDNSRDSMSEDLRHAVTIALETEIRKMEEQGEPVGDMSQLTFMPNMIAPVDVDEVLMVGSIQGEGWSGNGELFNVPREDTTATAE